MITTPMYTVEGLAISEFASLIPRAVHLTPSNYIRLLRGESVQVEVSDERGRIRICEAKMPSPSGSFFVRFKFPNALRPLGYALSISAVLPQRTEDSPELAYLALNASPADLAISIVFRAPWLVFHDDDAFNAHVPDLSEIARLVRASMVKT